MPSSISGARVTRPAVLYGQDTAHSSAPSICRTATGRLFMLYRQGTDHYVSRDGVFKLTHSDDDGRSWTAPETVLSLAPNWDLQGQGISESRDGSTLWLSYFKASSAAAAAGVFVRTSTDHGETWSDEARIDDLAVAATTDVILDLEDGTLLLGIYGRGASTETSDSAFVARSSDRGATWTLTRIKDGPADGRAYQEPVLAVNGLTVVAAFRWGSIQSVGTAVSTDGGWTWGAGAARFAGTGKPHVFWLDTWTLACIYRELGTGHARIRSSRDLGATWTPPRMVHPTYYPGGWMLYSSSTPIGGGQQLIAFAEERTSPGASPGTSRLFLAAADAAGTVTPFGAVPDSLTDIAAGLEELMFATRFEQPDGPAADPWSGVVNNGGATALDVVDGTLRPTAQGAFTIARVFAAGATDVDIEADLLTAAGAGSAAGIVFRQTAPGTFLVFVAEGTVCRLYRYASGTATLLATSAPMAHQFDAWNRLRVVARGTNVAGFYNGQLMVAATLSTADAAAYAGGQWHGLKLLPQAGGPGAHRCRRFVLRS